MIPDQRDHDSAARSESDIGYDRIGRTYVRVTGTRLGRFVEFEFFLNDEDLSVDLVLPFQAFDEFCTQNGCTILPPKDGAPDGVQQRGQGGGLYRRPQATEQ